MYEECSVSAASAFRDADRLLCSMRTPVSLWQSFLVRIIKILVTTTHPAIRISAAYYRGVLLSMHRQLDTLNKHLQQLYTTSSYQLVVHCPIALILLIPTHSACTYRGALMVDTR